MRLCDSFRQFYSSRYPLFLTTGLTDLAADILGLVLDTLTLIRLRTAEGTDFSTHLTNFLLADAGNGHFVSVNCCLNSFRNHIVNDCGIAKSESEHVLVQLGLVTYTIDQQAL